MSQGRQAIETISSKTDTKKLFDIKNFRLYVFQPKTAYYYLPFDERLSILELNIKKAAQQFKEANLPATAKALFVAPEYLFKDFSKEETECYYSHEEKKNYVQRILDLSKETDLIIAPGTICWRKEGNKAGEPLHFFRNSLYLFHQGTREKYKKTHLAESDQDHTLDGTLVKNIFKRGDKDEPIKKINELTIGVEICLDNNFSVIETHRKKLEELDIHLVLACRLKKSALPSSPGTLFIKIDSRPGYTKFSDSYPTEIGQLIPSKSLTTQHSELEYATCINEHGDLFCYEFIDPTPTSTINLLRLPPSCRLSVPQYIKDIKERIRACGLEDLHPMMINDIMNNVTLEIRHRHSIDIDFPDHLLALKKADLLSDENILALFSHPAYAAKYTKSLIEMKEAGLLTIGINDLLNDNIINARHLKNLFLLLQKHGYLTNPVNDFLVNTSKILKQFDALQVSDAYVIFYELIKLDLFNIKYLFLIFNGLREYNQLSKALKSIIKLVIYGLHIDNDASLASLLVSAIRLDIFKKFGFSFNDFIKHLITHNKDIILIENLVSDLENVLDFTNIKQYKACIKLINLVCGNSAVNLSLSEANILCEDMKDLLFIKHYGIMSSLKIYEKINDCRRPTGQRFHR